MSDRNVLLEMAVRGIQERFPTVIVSERDPYFNRLIAAPWKCPHREDGNCVCQYPVYKGLYVAPITDDKGVVRYCVVRVQMVHEGGMREFKDPVDNTVVGSCGCNFWYDGHVKSMEDFLNRDLDAETEWPV